jgi:DnaJ-like protein
MMVMATYYDDLGLPTTASAEEIKKQYRALAHDAHPDAKTGSDEAFVRLQKAYATLSDPELRADYDKKLAADQAPPKPATTPPRTAAYRRGGGPPPPEPNRFRWTWFRGVVGVLVFAIILLFVRVAVDWSGGIGISIPVVTPSGAATTTPTATPAETPTPSDTPTPTDTPTDTPTPTPTDTPSPSPSPTDSGSPLPTVTPL